MEELVKRKINVIIVSHKEWLLVMESIKNILKDLTSEHVALISVMVTILLFIFGRFNELKFKKHELKKEKYFQFIDMLKEIYLKEYVWYLD